MNTIDINDIIIPARFLEITPNKKKYELKRKKIESGIKMVVTVNTRYELIDGYISYLLYKELGILEVPFKIVLCKPSRKMILNMDNYTCYICGRQLPNGELTVDHVKPKTLGGTDTADNLRCCCTLCNSLKGQLSYSNELRKIIRRDLVLRGIEIV